MIWLPQIFEAKTRLPDRRGRTAAHPAALVNFSRRPERINMTTKIKERLCEACMGTGYPVVMQPVQPGRKIYPVRCRACEGKGKIADAS